ncbi:uncharacterized protein B0J16DRAFT_320258 [Fusarium flagelliforme]|uniref:uncharacterized protein n=1 Tax=Fusarium flagelliforme TaxID=2675880 RepID=UPI001E8CD739|nr:uncharacterized protein B0J16DRAFT_320258 [Fusarium flagelliforme]KAH7185483.1 hypothetical protein B0J16DRAFT_320258 [Fusarium flagelliforme]
MSFRNEYEEQVRAWGFNRVVTWSDSPNTHYPPHSHTSLTTHLITQGSMTLWYPNEEDSQKQIYGVGSRIDVDAGRVHEVMIGGSGCTMVAQLDNFTNVSSRRVT